MPVFSLKHASIKAQSVACDGNSSDTAPPLHHRLLVGHACSLQGIGPVGTSILGHRQSTLNNVVTKNAEHRIIRNLIGIPSQEETQHIAFMLN